jgi:hypothetical protein
MADYARTRGDVIVQPTELTRAARAAMEAAFPVRWGAIGSGAVISLVCQILLSLLGVALGFSALQFVSPEQDVTAAATSAFWWWAISGIVSAFAGGLIAGAATSDRASHAAVNALIAWATTTVFIAIALSGLGGTFGALGGPLAHLSQQIETVGQLQVLRELIVTLSFWSFVALLIGAASAIGGGRIGFNWNLAKTPGGVY